MDVTELFPEDIRKEHFYLAELYFSRDFEEEWEEFLKQFATKRYRRYMKRRAAYLKRMRAKGIIVN